MKPFLFPFLFLNLSLDSTTTGFTPTSSPSTRSSRASKVLGVGPPSASINPLALLAANSAVENKKNERKDKDADDRDVSSSSSSAGGRTGEDFGVHDDRREFLVDAVAKAAVAFTAAGGLVNPVARPANAFGGGGTDALNARLSSYGLPPISNVPSGMKPLLELYGKGKNRFPLLVQFAHPFTWVVQLPSNDANGEDGTVQAGEYAKGDTATFFLYENPGHVDDVTTAPRSLIETALQRAISQKGANTYQNFKVTKIVGQTDNPEYESGRRNYVTADFKYTLLTGAGFEVDRKGVASITSEGPAVEVLWTASTAIRYKKTEQTLRDIVRSFRVYGDGLNFSEEIARTQNKFEFM